MSQYTDELVINLVVKDQLVPAVLNGTAGEFARLTAGIHENSIITEGDLERIKAGAAHLDDVKLTALDHSLDTVKGDVKALGTAAEQDGGKLKTALHETGQAADSAAPKLKKVGDDGESAFHRIKEGAASFLAANVIQNLTSNLGSLFGDTISKAGDFSAEMSKIKATSGATDEQLASLRQTALNLGMATDVGSVSAKDAADAIFELGKAGVTADDINKGVAKSTLQLAAAAGPEFGVANAAALAADSMNTFGLSAKDSTNIVNTLVGSANASSIGLSELKFSLSAVGPVAHLVGMSMGDFNTAMAEFGMHGLKGSDAGTSLKTMLLNLQPTTKAAIAEFQKLGLVTLDLNKAQAKAADLGVAMTEAHGKWIVKGKAFGSQMEAVNQALYLAAGGHGVYTNATDKEQKGMDKLLNSTDIMNQCLFGSERPYQGSRHGAGHLANPLGRSE